MFLCRCFQFLNRCVRPRSIFGYRQDQHYLQLNPLHFETNGRNWPWCFPGEQIHKCENRKKKSLTKVANDSVQLQQYVGVQFTRPAHRKQYNKLYKSRDEHGAYRSILTLFMSVKFFWRNSSRQTCRLQSCLVIKNNKSLLFACKGGVQNLGKGNL